MITHQKITQTKVGDTLPGLLALAVYESRLEGDDLAAARQKYQTETPFEDRLKRAIMFTPMLRATLDAINDLITGEWSPGADADPATLALAAAFREKGLQALSVEAPAPAPAPILALPPLTPFGSPAPVAAPMAAITPPPLPALAPPGFGG